MNVNLTVATTQDHLPLNLSDRFQQQSIYQQLFREYKRLSMQHVVAQRFDSEIQLQFQ